MLSCPSIYHTHRHSVGRYHLEERSVRMSHGLTTTRSAGVEPDEGKGAQVGGLRDSGRALATQIRRADGISRALPDLMDNLCVCRLEFGVRRAPISYCCPKCRSAV